MSGRTNKDKRLFATGSRDHRPPSAKLGLLILLADDWADVKSALFLFYEFVISLFTYNVHLLTLTLRLFFVVGFRCCVSKGGREMDPFYEFVNNDFLRIRKTKILNSRPRIL